jgi:hypothetical protein
MQISIQKRAHSMKKSRKFSTGSPFPCVPERFCIQRQELFSDQSLAPTAPHCTLKAFHRIAEFSTAQFPARNRTFPIP